ncbi:MAG: hypothetical protein IJD37_01775 [Clostridia bacterium]|nr:hypothetical protein [Clostridia bacterium]
MTGKSKCKILKDIRRQIAEKNGIELVIEECKYKGDCLGTCPRCEAEVRYLEKELEKRRALGKKVAVAGLVATLTVSTTSCNLVDKVIDTSTAGIFPTEQSAELDGNIALPETMVTMGEMIPPETTETTAETNAPETEYTSTLSVSALLGTTPYFMYIQNYSKDEIMTVWKENYRNTIGNTYYFAFVHNGKNYLIIITFDENGTPIRIKVNVEQELLGAPPV